MGLQDILWTEMFFRIAGCSAVSQWIFGMIGCLWSEMFFETAGCSVVS